MTVHARHWTATAPPPRLPFQHENPPSSHLQATRRSCAPTRCLPSRLQMLDSFRELDARLFSGLGKKVDWIFLEVHAEGEDAAAAAA
jgi:hypothetical protein